MSGALCSGRGEQMQIILNDQGYIESYAIIGGLVDGIEIEAPDDLLEDFRQHPEAYKVADSVLVLDADKLKADADAAELTIIRRRRETECFAYINRGELWYSLLTDEQKAELANWYLSWLDAPETRTIPASPVWLDKL